jgi:hypothetical protein
MERGVDMSDDKDTPTIEGFQPKLNEKTHFDMDWDNINVYNCPKCSNSGIPDRRTALPREEQP